jgi:PAS domain S-box-containing protein
MRDKGGRLQMAIEAAHLAPWEYSYVTQEVVPSPRLMELFGFPRGTDPGVFNREWRTRLLEEDWPRLLEAGTGVGQGDGFHFQYRIRVPGGDIRWHECAGRPVADPSGRYTRLVGIVADITDRERADDALRETAKDLARSNQDLEHFAYAASHDLQEPLRMIKSFVGLLKERYAANLDETANQFMDLAVINAERMQALIDGLLEISRVGKQADLKQLIRVDDSLQAALENLKAAISLGGARITAVPLPFVVGNAVQLTQVFQNLIGNAIKFRSKQPPEVKITVKRVKQHWLFSLRDNGIGFDPIYADRVFVMFQRLHSADHIPGAGIGLAICKKIIDRHGGRIWVESQDQKGSTVFFTLPAPKKG